MENNANLSDGARQADTVSSEHAETMFGADQAETNMVKLVDGKLVSTGDTKADVSEDMPRIRLGSDEERALVGDDKKKYENSESALRVGNEFAPEAMPNDPIAVADITGNPDAGSTVNTGLPSEDAPNDQTQPDKQATQTNSFGTWNYIGSGPSGDMIPPTPGTPDPMQPVPGIPETSPTPSYPGPEIPDLPGSPTPGTPEIPDFPDTPKPAIPDIQNRKESSFTFTSAGPGVIPTSGPKPDDSIAETRYEGLAEAAKAEPGSEEGMQDKPDTGDSAHPYDVNAKDTAQNQAGERPEEAKEAQQLPREMADESSIMAQDMISGPDRSDQKSTDGLDRNYNDPQAAREMAT